MIKNIYFNNKETVNNFFWRILQTGGKQTVSFLIYFVSAKFLITLDFGLLSYMMASIFFLIIFCDFGISTAVSKYVAESSIVSNDKVKIVFFNSLFIYFCLFIIIFFIFLIFGEAYFGNNIKYSYYLIPLLFFIPLTSLYDGLFRGLKRFKELSFISVIVGVISLIIAFLIIPNYGITGSLISQNIYYLLFSVIMIIFYGKLVFKINFNLIKKICSYSFLIGVANIGTFLYVKIDVLVLGWFGYIKEIAFYDLSNNIFIILALPVTVFAQVISPDITRKYSMGKSYLYTIAKAKNYFFRSIIFGTIFSTLFYFFIPFIVKFFFINYNQELFYYYFTILLIIFPIRIFGTILADSFIISTGYAKILTINNLVFGCINVILDIIFIHLYGFKGVMYSTLLLGYTSVIIAYFRFIYLLKKNEQKRI